MTIMRPHTAHRVCDRECWTHAISTRNLCLYTRLQTQATLPVKTNTKNEGYYRWFLTLTLSENWSFGIRFDIVAEARDNSRDDDKSSLLGDKANIMFVFICNIFIDLFFLSITFLHFLNFPLYSTILLLLIFFIYLYIYETKQNKIHSSYNQFFSTRMEIMRFLYLCIFINYNI